MITNVDGIEPPQPPKPVSYRPGTLERIETYRWRVEHGFGLWHPEDNRNPIRDSGKRSEKLVLDGGTDQLSVTRTANSQPSEQ